MRLPALVLACLFLFVSPALVQKLDAKTVAALA